MAGASALVDSTDAAPGEVAQGAVALELLAQLGVGLVLVGMDRYVFSASLIAERMFGAADGLVVRAGLLHASLQPMDVMLGQHLAHGHHGAARSRFIAVVRPSGKPALLVAIVGTRCDLGATAVRVAMVWDGEHGSAWCAEALADLHGLTRAEARTVLAMLAEHSVPKVARRMGLSNNTVRTHLKQAFRKCGVRGWAQLAVQLAGNPLRGSLDRVSREA